MVPNVHARMSGDPELQHWAWGWNAPPVSIRDPSSGGLAKHVVSPLELRTPILRSFVGADNQHDICFLLLNDLLITV